MSFETNKEYVGIVEHEDNNSKMLKKDKWNNNEERDVVICHQKKTKRLFEG